MATKIYEYGYIHLVDGTSVYITPLKIKYLREFMDAFENVKASVTEEESTTHLLECVRISMQQYYPQIETIFDVEDNMDIKTLYRILDLSAGIKISNEKSEEDKELPEKAKQASEDSSWEKLDLATLESEVFQLGIWKDYEDLERSMSLPELMATLNSKRESDYAEKKFLAAIQGVDLEKNSGKSNEWEEMKARVFSKGQASNANDITALQGANAQKAGFGIGMGMSYQKVE
jgi:hypothetical protein